MIVVAAFMWRLGTGGYVRIYRDSPQTNRTSCIPVMRFFFPSLLLRELFCFLKQALKTLPRNKFVNSKQSILLTDCFELILLTDLSL